MAVKVLGQLASTTTLTALYTCPANTETVISTLVVCNRSNLEKTYTIVVRPNNETLENKHYITSSAIISPNDSIALTLGITIDSSDVIYVSGSDTNISFTAFGNEKSV